MPCRGKLLNMRPLCFPDASVSQNSTIGSILFTTLCSYVSGRFDARITCTTRCVLERRGRFLVRGGRVVVRGGLVPGRLLASRGRFFDAPPRGFRDWLLLRFAPGALAPEAPPPMEERPPLYCCHPSGPRPSAGWTGQ